MSKKDYEVGKSKPPREHQFPKGKSGNPKGRPKGRMTLKSVIDDEMMELVTIPIDGERVTLPAINALVRLIIRRGIAGKPKNETEALSLARSSDLEEKINYEREQRRLARVAYGIANEMEHLNEDDKIELMHKHNLFDPPDEDA